MKTQATQPKPSMFNLVKTLNINKLNLEGLWYYIYSTI